MPTPAELEADFWKALRSDMTCFLGCDGAPPRPMTACMDGEENTAPIWFFTASDTDLGETLGANPKPGIMTFASKGHNIWASASGTLTLDTRRDVVDRLWNPFVAAWYEGKDDPKLRLVRFEATDAQIWENGNSLVAGIKILLGSDPKEDYKDQTAKVALND